MRRPLPGKCAAYGALALLVTFILAPVAWLFITSISSEADLTARPLHWLPASPSFAKYRALFQISANSAGETFVYALRNSLAAACGAAAAALVVGIPAAYSFSRWPGRRLPLMYLVIATYMLPPVAIILPVYVVFSQTGLLNTLPGLVIVYCTILMPFVTWLLKSKFDGVPREIEEAAIMDGAKLWNVLRHVTLPLAKAGLGAAALFGLLLAWDEFFYALLLTNDDRAKTIPVAIADFAAGRATDFALIAAAGILASLPPIIIAFLLQKSLVKGLAAGGVKG